MQMFETIVVPTDDGPDARQAVSNAGPPADRYRAAAHPLAVVQGDRGVDQYLPEVVTEKLARTAPAPVLSIRTPGDNAEGGV
ncbi:hypothetical protein [Haloarcula montana]|uniref:hypothetical protein n=1 Tax=Haloarcula montana TaxID=3111776 RepID=UPI002D79E8FD|nr:hypothetical protein [Haloarcula sp. GH36]